MPTNKELIERFEERKAEFLDFDKASGSRYINDEKLLSFLSQEIHKAVSEERTEVNEACKKLAQIADWKTVTDDMRTSATMALQAKAEEDRVRYIRTLEENLHRAVEEEQERYNKALTAIVNGDNPSWTIPSQGEEESKN